MKNFNIECTYQPINDTWSAVIKHGNSTFTEVHTDLNEAIVLVTEKFLEAYPPVCRTCGGTGEVSSMERVYANEPHMADVGTQPCPDCHPPREEEHDNQE